MAFFKLGHYHPFCAGHFTPAKGEAFGTDPGDQFWGTRLPSNLRVTLISRNLPVTIERILCGGMITTVESVWSSGQLLLDAVFFRQRQLPGTGQKGQDTTEKYTRQRSK